MGGPVRRWLASQTWSRRVNDSGEDYRECNRCGTYGELTGMVAPHRSRDRLDESGDGARLPRPFRCLVSRHRYGRADNDGDQILWTCGRCGHEKWSKTSYLPTAGPPPPKLLPGGGGPG